MSPRNALALLALISTPLLSGCETLYPKLVDRQPDASLLLPSARPALPPAKPTYTDAVLGWIDAVQKYLDLEDKFNALATFVKAGKP